MDFIITSLQSWDIAVGSTIKNTAAEISKQHRTFYVSTPPTLSAWLRGRTKKPDLTVNDNLHIIYCNTPALPVSSMPFRRMFKMMNYINNFFIAHTIKKTIRKYNIQSYVHLIDNDIYRSRYLKQLLHPDISIYYRRDYVISADYWRKYGPQCEQELVRQSDIVMTNSTYFTQELSAYNSNIYTTNTGVNLELYDASIHHDMPEDMQSIPSPRIGYMGAIIEARLDAELLYRVAQRMSQCRFVFVGPEDDFFKSHPLHTLKNVHFLGQKAVSQLPEYVQYFDVCINPQIVNSVTIGNYPLKIDEYLAMGKPIVATGTHTMRDVFAAHTHLATDADSYVQAIEDALKEAKDEDLQKARIAFAHTHSWAHSVEKIYAAIEEYKKKRCKSINE